MRYTFKVQERLKREQHIKTLFHNGKAFSSFPLKCIWLPLDRDNETSPVRFAVSVPKKKTPLSVNRQRIKRLIREAWRLNKHLLYAALPADKQLHVFFIFTNKGLPQYTEIEAAMLVIIYQLVEHYQTNIDA